MGFPHTGSSSMRTGYCACRSGLAKPKTAPVFVPHDQENYISPGPQNEIARCRVRTRGNYRKAASPETIGGSTTICLHRTWPMPGLDRSISPSWTRTPRLDLPIGIVRSDQHPGNPGITWMDETGGSDGVAVKPRGRQTVGARSHARCDHAGCSPVFAFKRLWFRA